VTRAFFLRLNFSAETPAQALQKLYNKPYAASNGHACVDLLSLINRKVTFPRCALIRWDPSDQSAHHAGQIYDRAGIRWQARAAVQAQDKLAREGRTIDPDDCDPARAEEVLERDSTGVTPRPLKRQFLTLLTPEQGKCLRIEQQCASQFFGHAIR
jgi:hypothetical protein